MNAIFCLHGLWIVFLFGQQTAVSLQLKREITSTDTFAPTEDPLPVLESTKDDDSYVAGVVEFRKSEIVNDSVHNTTGHYFEVYERLVRSIEARPVDIIIFPGHVLNTFSDPVFIPHPSVLSIPCLRESAELLSLLSCLAADVRKYLVITLSEIQPCEETEQENSRPCGQYEFRRYNTNVVFDRNGAVIARYRHLKLFHEELRTKTAHLPEVATFETDFGVTFGILSGPDLLAAWPALELVKRNVKDFVFPVTWTSESPFLTAVQIFEGWAYANNVNLLAAGTNSYLLGNTGSGVFNGRNGAIFSFMTGKLTRSLFSVRVPKQSSNSYSLTPDLNVVHLHGQDLENIRMYHENFEHFTMMQITPERTHENIGQIICNGDFCCDFSVTVTQISDRDFTHYHRFAVYDGMRLLPGSVDAHVSICGIVTCRNKSITSCGLPMHENSNYLVFHEIIIRGRFRANGTLVMPNSLDDMLHSLSPKEYDFSSTINYTTNQQDVTLRLTSQVDNLQTFAIYAVNHENFEFYNYIKPSTESPPILDAKEEESDDATTKKLSLILMILTPLSMAIFWVFAW